MAIEDITKNIIKEARHEVDKMNTQTGKEITEIKKEYKEKSARVKKDLEAKQEQELSTWQRKYNLELEQEIKQAVLAKKHELIDQVFKQALQEAGNMSENDYVNLLVKLFKQLPAQSDFVISCPAKRKKQTQQALEKKGKSWSISNEDLSSKGGFIASNEKLTINATFETLIQDQRDELELEIAQALFSK